MQRVESMTTVDEEGHSQPAMGVSPPRAKVMIEEFDIVKIVVVGRGNCGKSSYIRQLTSGSFITSHRTTMGCDFSEKRYRIGQRLVSVHLWDIFGQESAPSMLRLFFAQSRGAIVMYDVSTPGWEEAAIQWKAEIDKINFGSTSLRIPTLLIGNKCDVLMPGSPSAGREDDQDGPKRQVFNDAFLFTKAHGPPSREHMENFVNEHHFLSHFFASAKSAYNIKESLEFLLVAILKTDPMSTGATANVGAIKSMRKPASTPPNFVRRDREKRKPPSSCSL